MDETIDTMGRQEQAHAGGHDRRNFLRFAGLGGAAVALAACGVDPTRVTQASASAPVAATPTAAGTIITLDFSSDLGVLNYAYALEQLEAAFYAQVLASTQFSSIFSAAEQRVLTDLRDHEAIHRAFFKAALAGAAIPSLTANFSSIDFTSRTSVLNAAVAFEDTGVSAYNGAGQYIQNAAYLGLAGKIVSVEARHASAIRDILSPRTDAFAPNPFDAPNTPQNVIKIAQAYIVETLTVTNVPA